MPLTAINFSNNALSSLVMKPYSAEDVFAHVLIDVHAHGLRLYREARRTPNRDGDLVAHPVHVDDDRLGCFSRSIPRRCEIIRTIGYEIRDSNPLLQFKGCISVRVRPFSLKRKGLNWRKGLLSLIMRRRFFVDQVRNGHAEISGDDARHLTRVLRVEAGQRYEISDNRAVYLAEIETARKEHVISGRWKNCRWSSRPCA